MKKVIFLALLTSPIFASTQSDVALTWGHNNFNEDDATLYDSASYYGVRAGFYTDQNIGLQLGYEQTNSANCIGLKLKRFYTNAIIQKEITDGLKPYLVGTLGYEISSAEYRDSQTFLGFGLGLKYNFSNNFNLFIESRALRNLTSEDTTFSTTAGMGYQFDTTSNNSVDKIEKPTALTVKKRKKIRLRPVLEEIPKLELRARPASMINTYHDRIAGYRTLDKRAYQERYYVQVEALTTSSPTPLLRKLRARGVTRISLKKKGIYTFIVVGPYVDRVSATKAQEKLKSINPNAFIKKF